MPSKVRRRRDLPAKKRDAIIKDEGSQSQGVAPSRTRRAGRPTLLNDAKAQVILDAVRTGAPLSTAARAAGVDPETLRRWRRLGESARDNPQRAQDNTEARFVEFCGLIDQAIAEALITAQVVVFQSATQTNDLKLAFRAATWFLTHRDPSNYSMQVTLDTLDRETAALDEVDEREVWQKFQAIARAQEQVATRDDLFKSVAHHEAEAARLRDIASSRP